MKLKIDNILVNLKNLPNKLKPKRDKVCFTLHLLHNFCSFYYFLAFITNQGGVKTLRGGGGKKKIEEEPKKTSWFGSLFNKTPTPSPKKPAEREARPLEMSSTNVFDD